MALNAAATTIPGKGTVLVAPPDTAAPTFATLDPTSPTSPWVTIGHTSRTNAVTLSKDGGDPTVVGSWWEESLRATRASTTWGVTVNSLQIDALTLGLAFPGGTVDAVNGSYGVGSTTAVDKALFILALDTGNGTRLGIYIPNTSVSIGDAPEFAVDNFFEIQLSATLQNSPTTGEQFRIFHPALIVP